MSEEKKSFLRSWNCDQKINLSSFFSDDVDDSDIDEISEVPQEANGDADSDSDESEEFMLDGAPETEVLSSD